MRRRSVRVLVAFLGSLLAFPLLLDFTNAVVPLGGNTHGGIAVVYPTGQRWAIHNAYVAGDLSLPDPFLGLSSFDIKEPGWYQITQSTYDTLGNLPSLNGDAVTVSSTVEGNADSDLFQFSIGASSSVTLSDFSPDRATYRFIDAMGRPTHSPTIRLTSPHAVEVAAGSVIAVTGSNFSASDVGGVLVDAALVENVIALSIGDSTSASIGGISIDRGVFSRPLKNSEEQSTSFEPVPPKPSTSREEQSTSSEPVPPKPSTSREEISRFIWTPTDSVESYVFELPERQRPQASGENDGRGIWIYVDKPGVLQVVTSRSPQRPPRLAPGVVAQPIKSLTLERVGWAEFVYALTHTSLGLAVVFLFALRGAVVCLCWMLLNLALERFGYWSTLKFPRSHRPAIKKQVQYFLVISRVGGYMTLAIWTAKDIAEFAFL